ncbi:MAG: hypothetical protein ACFFC7_07270 [Candidatus Hermodarchaeota archaeon]
MPKTYFYYSDEYLSIATLPTDHPFWDIRRFELIYRLARFYRVFGDKISLKEPPFAVWKDLTSFHNFQYVEALQMASDIGMSKYGLGKFGLGTEDCPTFPGAHDLLSLVVGGTMDAIKTVMKAENGHQYAFHYLGGLHHAQPDMASGFCYYNDIAIGIRDFQKKYPEKKLLYLDLDVHHGDGIEENFITDPKVMKISIHQFSEGFYPGTGNIEAIGEGEGKGYNCNVPLPAGCTDDLYLYVFDEIIPHLWLRYDPDLVIVQFGTDTHWRDPQAGMALTNLAYKEMTKKICDLTSKTSEGRLIVLGGGGYDPITIARSLMVILAEMAELNLPNELPLEWIEFCFEKYNLKVPVTTLLDPPVKPKKALRPLVEEIVKEVKEKVFQPW